MEDEIKLTEIKNKATVKFEDICTDILNGSGSFTTLLVRAFRLGHDKEKARTAFDALKAHVDQARVIYEAAISHPEAVITKRRVEL